MFSPQCIFYVINGEYDFIGVLIGNSKILFKLLQIQLIHPRDFSNAFKRDCLTRVLSRPGRDRVRSFIEIIVDVLGAVEINPAIRKILFYMLNL